MNFLKNNFAIGIITLLVATASCSFTNTIDPGDKEKEEVLIQLVGQLLKRNHFSPADLTDQFSADVYKNFINDLDPGRRYFLASDIEEFKVYEYQIDDQIREGNVALFTLAYERLLKRQDQSEKIYLEVIQEPLDFDKQEEIDTDYEKMSYAENKAQLKDHWRKLIKLSVLGNYYDKIEEQADLKDQSKAKSEETLKKEAIEEVRKSLAESFDLNDDVERMDYFSLFMNAITTHFDPHTNFFPPRNKDRFDTSMSGKLEGIGARLQKKMDYISVIEIISGGPAWRSEKIEIGDKILKVKQEKDTVATSIVGMRIADAVELIKGPKGTKVILTLKKVDGTVEDLTLTRDVVEIEETFAKSMIIENEGMNYGLIDLPKFYFDMEDRNGRAAGEDIANEIIKLKKQGMQGLVLDLRNNGGGSLGEVIKMAGLFIEEGPVVQVAYPNGRTRIHDDPDNGEVLWDGPLVIMVNEFSASASEILAAAMQDYDRAVILGSKQTFGKGTVQQFQDLNRYITNGNLGDFGFIKLTTQKFYRVNGGSTQLEGVKSDVVAPDRYSYIDLGEKDEQFPLPYDEIPAAEYNRFTGYLNLSEAIKNSQERIDNDPKFQLIDESAQWLKKQREDNVIPLNLEAYKNRLENLENQSKRFDQFEDYKNELSFKLTPSDEFATKQDSILKKKRERWQEGLQTDLYLNEAVNILKDLKMKNIKNSNLTLKD
ncbi:carboxy terminal-processing peptidase [Nonlabens tegetincola]|uniref:carboxy terminal-processing peptidase n=1 Tax=Nonlabens tegetincola TaxID=323273 RepID=UPI0030C85678